MQTKQAVTALAALAQDRRLAVFRLLVQQGPSGMAAGEIAAALKLSPATLSFHLKELANARLVLARPDGRFIFYSADFTAMNTLIAYLTENCCAADCGPDASCAPGASTGASLTSSRTTSRTASHTSTRKTRTASRAAPTTMARAKKRARLQGVKS